MIRERGPDCTGLRGGCPRCQHEASEDADAIGHAKDLKHALLPEEDRNGYWVNFEIDTFLLNYRSKCGRYIGGNLPDISYFVFETRDLVQIQQIGHAIEPKRTIRRSLHWYFNEHTAMQGLQSVKFLFRETRHKDGERKATLGRELLRVEERDKFFTQVEKLAAESWKNPTTKEFRWRWYRH